MKKKVLLVKEQRVGAGERVNACWERISYLIRIYITIIV